MDINKIEEERKGRLNQERRIDEAMRQKKETENFQTLHHKRISNTIAVFMSTAALLFDGVQAVLEWFLIGFAVNWMINILVWLTFFVWFKFNGVSFMGLKRAAIFNGGFFLEFIPLVAELPLWTATIIMMIIMVKLEDKVGVKLAGIAK